MNKEQYTMICPKCNSIDVNIDKSNPLQATLGLPVIYACNKCGYSGNIFPEIKISELENLKKR